MPTIGVAIPCYEPHHYLINGLVDNAIAQTRRPDRVVISCSSWQENSRRDMICGGIPITILYWKRPIVQAENRNIAARELGTDIITFLDADDLMHPRRLEYMLRAFEESKCDVIVHDYQWIKEGSNIPFADEPVMNLTDDVIVKKPYEVGCMLENGEQPFHHAHLGITKEAFSKVQFPINAVFYRIEDSVYLGMLVDSQMKIRYLANKLSQYTY